MLPSGTESKINEAALSIVAALHDLFRQLLAQDLDHVHIGYMSGGRFAEAGDLLECEVSYQLTVCPTGTCGEPDDGGIKEWNAWRSNKRLVGQEGIEARSDEEMAAAAIRVLCEPQSIQKLPERANGRTPDFMVTLADGRRAGVEVTMHTDADRRALHRQGQTFSRSTLGNRWRVVAFDSRFLGSYDGGNSFNVKSLQKALAGALVRVEAGGGELDDYERITELCESEIARSWQWAKNEILEDGPPIRLAIIGREPAEPGQGSLNLSVAPCTLNFHKVVEISDLVSAIQERIEHKLNRNQWADTATDERWLVILLDGGAAATQLVESFEFEDHQHDFSGITFPGIDEVWAVTFCNGNLTVLRFVGSSAHWEHRPKLPPQTD